MIDIQTVRVHDALTQRRKAMQTLGAALVLGAIMWIPVLLPDWSGWTTPPLVVVPGLLALATMRFSTAASAYLIQGALFFGVT